MKYMRLFFITALVGVSTLNVNAELDGTSLSDRSQQANSAFQILEKIKKIEVDDIFEKQDELYVLRDTVVAVLDQVEKLDKDTKYFSGIVQDILLAKVSAYFMKEYIKIFFTNDNLKKDDKSADNIKKSLLEHIGSGFSKITNWEKKGNNDLFSISKENFETKKFNIKILNLDKLVNTISTTLFTAFQFIKEFRVALGQNKKRLLSFFNEETILFKDQNITIKKYIEEVADLLDKKITQTLISLTKHAAKLIESYISGNNLPENAFNVSTPLRQVLKKDFSTALQQDVNEISFGGNEGIIE